jgi:hypothetical protein
MLSLIDCAQTPLQYLREFKSVATFQNEKRNDASVHLFCNRQFEQKKIFNSILAKLQAKVSWKAEAESFVELLFANMADGQLLSGQAAASLTLQQQVVVEVKAAIQEVYQKDVKNKKMTQPECNFIIFNDMPGSILWAFFHKKYYSVVSCLSRVSLFTEAGCCIVTASAEMSLSPAQLEQLNSLDLVHVFARCCDNHEKLSTTLVDIVKILRERRFYMTTPHEASAVRDLIKSACGATRKKADTIERYVSSLVKCLRMPPHVFQAMPSISITHLKLPNVEWYGVGDDVYMYISAAWSHAIVIETKDVVATNVNDVRIQFVGHPKGRKIQHG